MSSETHLLEEAIVRLRNEPVPPFVDPFPDRDAQASLGLQVQVASSIRLRNSSRRLRFPLLTIAAPMALMALLALLAVTIPDFGKPRVAFAQVQESIARAKSLRCKFLDYHGDKDPLVTTIVSLEGVGSRSDQPNGRESITNYRERRVLLVDHRRQTAEVRELFLDEGETNHQNEFYDRLRSITSGESQELEPITENGKKILRFKFHLQGEFLVYVDPKTKLPIRMEMKLEKGTPRNQGFREVITDFVFDAPVDDSLFGISPPPGYKITRSEEPNDRPRIDTSKIVVSHRSGFHSISLGADREQVIAKLGKADMATKSMFGAPQRSPAEEVKNDSSYIEELSYPSLGIDVSCSSQSGVTEFRCYGRNRLGPLARDFRGATDKGIKLGASIESVRAAYGKPDFSSTGRGDSLHYFHQGWEFQFSEGKLASFSMTKPMPESMEIIDHGDGTYTQKAAQKPAP